MNTCKSFLKLKTCGFRRTAAFFVVSSNQLCEENGTIHEEYCLMFEESIEYISFISNANRLKVLFQKWGKRKSGERLRYVETFQPKIYKNLSNDKKMNIPSIIVKAVKNIFQICSLH